jgi:type I restriction enzyme S subunit
MSSEVPEGWSVRSLGQIADLTMGQSPPSSAVTDSGDGLPFIQGNAEFGARHPAPRFVTSITPKVAQKGDILISVRAPVGEVNIAESPLCIGRGVAGIRAKDCDPAFLFYATGGLSRTFARLSQGSTFDAINGKELRAIEILLPPLDEQRRIAEVLRSVDEAIASANDVERVGEIVFLRRREELIGEARRASPEISVAAALRKNRGEKLLKLQTDRYADAGRYPIVDQGARFICGFTDEESAVWPYDLPVIVFGDHTRILKFVDFPFVIGADGTQCLNPIEEIQPRYFYYALQSLDLKAEGYARHFKLLKEKTIPVPTIHEQAAIERELAAIEAAVAEAQQARLKLAGLKAALAEELLSGRVRVPA